MKGTNAILAISIAINIFLLGSIAGAAFWLEHGERMIMAGSLRIVGSELPAGERKAFRRELRDTRRAMADKVIEARAARARAADLLRQPSVDAAALSAALTQARAAELAVRAAVEARAVDFVKALPVEDRQAPADAIVRRGKVRAKDDD